VLAHSSETKKTGQKSSYERPDEADDHVHEEAKAGSLHQFPGDPASKQSNNDPRNYSMSHVAVLLEVEIEVPDV